MRVLLAGATGAIGRPLIRGLTQRGHNVFGFVRSVKSTDILTEMGAEALIGDALDAASVRAAVARVRPDAVINELTALPRHYTPVEMKAAAERDTRVRKEGNVNLLAVMREPVCVAMSYSLRDSGMHQAGIWLTKANALPMSHFRWGCARTGASAAGADLGHGQGVWNWIHIDDPADATVRTLDCAPGAYNIVMTIPASSAGG